MIVAFGFEEAADRLAQTMPARLFNERVERDLHVEDADGIRGAVCYLPLIFPSLVLTTNLDDVLETLYQTKNRVFNHVLVGTNILRFRAMRAETESFLLKLPGDCRTQEGRVLGCAEYERAYAAGGILFQELGLIFRTKSLLFLGCSLGRDRTVDLIAKVAAQDVAMPKHYAFLKGFPDDEARIEQEHFLTERGIYPIWYREDHDECIEALLVGIAKGLGKL